MLNLFNQMHEFVFQLLPLLPFATLSLLPQHSLRHTFLSSMAIKIYTISYLNTCIHYICVHNLNTHTHTSLAESQSLALQYIAPTILSITRAAICTELGQHFSTQHPSFSLSLSLLITNSSASSSFLVISSLYCNLYNHQPIAQHPRRQKMLYCAHTVPTVKIKLAF